MLLLLWPHVSHHCALPMADRICIQGPTVQFSGSLMLFLLTLSCASLTRPRGYLSELCFSCLAQHSLTHVPQNGEALIKYGERGDKLYLIRYGKVRILRPDDSAPGGRVEVAKLGRGNLVGERTVVTGAITCFVASSSYRSFTWSGMHS